MGRNIQCHKGGLRSSILRVSMMSGKHASIRKQEWPRLFVTKYVSPSRLLYHAGRYTRIRRTTRSKCWIDRHPSFTMTLIGCAERQSLCGNGTLSNHSCEKLYQARTMWESVDTPGVMSFVILSHFLVSTVQIYFLRLPFHSMVFLGAIDIQYI